MKLKAFWRAEVRRRYRLLCCLAHVLHTRLVTIFETVTTLEATCLFHLLLEEATFPVRPHVVDDPHRNSHHSTSPIFLFSPPQQAVMNSLPTPIP